ncbi:MAG TPA: ABC transporter substrate-binding protein [Thermoleophilia bacterium]|nr:ABC transporter substrate-binding protein [Thermoleophilia bacterium]
MRDELAAYASDLEAAYGISLLTRIALNTGPVVLSRVTDVLEIAYNALGDTVTSAVRLQNAAQPGSIVAAENTARLITPLFEMREIGPLTLKGKAVPIATAELLKWRPVVGKPRGIPGLASPLVGRDRELTLLSDSLGALSEGRGQIVTIMGEPGIGKSRLVAEAQRGSPEVRWLEGRCLSYAGTIPYFPFLDLLREWLGVTATDHQAKVGIELRTALDTLLGPRAETAYPYLASMLHLDLEAELAARIADLSPESLQHQTFLVIQEWAAHLAAWRPLALLLDDLHWADGTSLALLEAMMAATEAMPILLCLLFRPDREHGCWRVNDIARQRFPHRHIEIALEPLAPADAEQLVTNLLMIPNFPLEVRDLILQRAEGNPFFVEEVIRSLIEVGMLVREEDQGRASRRISGIDIPSNIQGVLLARIDRLPEVARGVLKSASVIGRLFSLDLLRMIAGANGTMDAALADLQRRGLIVERRRIPQVEYRFKHALTQEVAYGTLVEPERRRLHREVARALEAQYADRREEIYGLLAHHYDEAGEQEPALDCLVRAGDKSRREYSDEEAIRHYTRAVNLMKQRGEWRAAAHTLMKAALAHHIAFRFRAANLAYQEAFAILEQAPHGDTGRLPPAKLTWSVPPPGRDAIDVHFGRSAFASFVADQLYDGLLRDARDSSLLPALARSWEVSDDGTRYLFRLHRDRKWSDGRSVTVHDFVYSWFRGMRSQSSRDTFRVIAGANDYIEGRTEDSSHVGVHALDDYTLQVQLARPEPFFPFWLADSEMLPQPRWAIERYGDEWATPGYAVTNGPYRIAEWRDTYLNLTVDPEYSDREGNVRDARLVFERYGDPSLFQEAKVDLQFLSLVQEEHAALLRDFLYLGRFTSTRLIYFRCDRPPFSDRRLRLAFAHATPRQATLPANKTNVVSADGGLIPPTTPGHSPHIAVSFDPTRARQLLEEAGYPGGKGLGPFTVIVPERIFIPSEVPQGSWQDILGVQVTVTAVPPREYFRQAVESPQPINRIAWFIERDPVALRWLYHSTSGVNFGRWKNEKFDALVEEAEASTDHRRRMTLCHEADHLLVAEEAAIIPMLYRRTAMLVQRYVKGFPARIADLIVEREG